MVISPAIQPECLVSAQLFSLNRDDYRNLGAIRQCQRFLDETQLCREIVENYSQDAGANQSSRLEELHSCRTCAVWVNSVRSLKGLIGGRDISADHLKGFVGPSQIARRATSPLRRS